MDDGMPPGRAAIVASGLALVLGLAATAFVVWLLVASMGIPSRAAALMVAVNLALTAPVAMRYINHRTVPYLQWLATLVTGGLVVLGLLSIGPFFLPAALASLVAALILTLQPRPPRRPTTTPPTTTPPASALQ